MGSVATGSKAKLKCRGERNSASEIRHWHRRGIHDTTPVRPDGGRGDHLTEPIRFMSLHRSLRAASALGAKRNVLKRFERVELLKKRGQWKAGDRITGLRKTKIEG